LSHAAARRGRRLGGHAHQMLALEIVLALLLTAVVVF
jgi:hypothetical protein